MKFSKIVIYSALIMFFFGCKRESFDTLVNISLVSGINKLSVLPCEVLIYRRKVEDNLLNSWVFINTITTDSLGNTSQWLSLRKPKKNEFYTAELIESKWQLPISGKIVIKAGIQNDIGFRIKPKWLHQIILEDSSGKFELKFFKCHNSQTLNFYQTQKFDSFPLNGLELIYGSAPSYSHIFITLLLRSRATKNQIEIKKIYDSESKNNIWIKF